MKIYNVLQMVEVSDETGTKFQLPARAIFRMCATSLDEVAKFINSFATFIKTDAATNKFVAEDYSLPEVEEVSDSDTDEEKEIKNIMKSRNQFLTSNGIFYSIRIRPSEEAKKEIPEDKVPGIEFIHFYISVRDTDDKVYLNKMAINVPDYDPLTKTFITKENNPEEFNKIKELLKNETTTKEEEK